MTSDYHDDIQHGLWLISHYQTPLTIAVPPSSHPITGYEMDCLLRASRYLAEQKREREGCCGDGDQYEGRCYGCGGWCPRMSEVRQAEEFCKSFLEWINKQEGDEDGDSIDD